VHGRIVELAWSGHGHEGEAKVMIHSAMVEAGRVVARNRRSRVIQSLATLARRYLDSYENLDYDIGHNGERRVVEIFGALGAACFLDVGANEGDWAAFASGAAPSAEIHCFEIVEPTARVLAEKAGILPNVVVNSFGLSDRVGTVDVRYFPERSVLSTTVDYPQPFASVVVQGRVETGDAYLSASGLAHVDLLKIDVEGAEHRVLLGFASSLAAGTIRAVQFEYGKANIVEGFLLKDLYALFEQFGYRLGKIYPRSVEFRPYRFEDEDFRGPNYLAVHESQGELIELLRG
jgi:FkbM family methyltransferase